MEDFESTSLPESSGLASGSEKGPEKSEKQKEAYKKAQAQLQKSQKDEKKAKSDNDDLFLILSRFIQNPYFEELVPDITELLQQSIPSRFIIGLISLVYPEAALYILTKQDKRDDINILLSLHMYPEVVVFHEQNIHQSIRDWMSRWVQFSGVYLASTDASHILQNKLITLMKGDCSDGMLSSMSTCIHFFFTSRNIQIPEKVTDSYADFILKEYIKLISQTLEQVDQDLLEMAQVDTLTLFGVSSSDGSRDSA